jgi:hypothetical protein
MLLIQISTHLCLILALPSETILFYFGKPIDCILLKDPVVLAVYFGFDSRFRKSRCETWFDQILSTYLYRYLTVLQVPRHSLLQWQSRCPKERWIVRNNPSIVDLNFIVVATSFNSPHFIRATVLCRTLANTKIPFCTSKLTVKSTFAPRQTTSNTTGI